MKLLYWIFRLVAKSISLLPFGLIYIFSDFLAFCLGSIIRYRKKVVVSNLKNAFPEKSNDEIRNLTKGFYRNLADITFEVIKLETITKQELFNRVSVEGVNIFREIYENNQGVVAVMSHTANWEWVSQRLCFEGTVFDDVGVIAKEMSNPYFEGYFANIRMQLQQGIAEIIPFTETAKYLALKRHKRSMIIAIADQSPHINQIKFRMPFLNQDTGIFLGPERIARSLNYALVFCHVQRTGRGHYKISFELLSETHRETADYDITRAHVKMLEDDITKAPDAWLWSHRRWKY